MLNKNKWLITTHYDFNFVMVRVHFIINVNYKHFNTARIKPSHLKGKAWLFEAGHHCGIQYRTKIKCRWWETLALLECVQCFHCSSLHCTSDSWEFDRELCGRVQPGLLTSKKKINKKCACRSAPSLSHSRQLCNVRKKSEEWWSYINLSSIISFSSFLCLHTQQYH